jgi:DNA-binding IclR family transcriptional regulator
MPVPALTDFWGELESHVMCCLAEGREMTPAEIGERVGMSEHATCSILAMLAEAGKVRITSVARLV